MCAYRLVNDERRADVLAEPLEALDVGRLHGPVKCTSTSWITVVYTCTITEKESIANLILKVVGHFEKIITLMLV